MLAEDLLVTSHAADELTDDRIDLDELLGSMATARVVESDRDDPRGPNVLLLHETGTGRLLHAVWGIPAGEPGPAVLITAYEPDPTRWDPGFVHRRRKP